MINPKAIDHVCLWVRSLKISSDYYESVFNMTCAVRADMPDTLILESNTVHFFIRECSDETGFIKKQHLSFEVECLQKVITALQKIGIDEYTLGETDFMQHRNYKWCEWLDPDGIRLECIEVLH